MNINAHEFIWSLDPLFKGDRKEMKHYCLEQSLRFWNAKMEALTPEQWDSFAEIEQLFDECARILEEEESTHE